MSKLKVESCKWKVESIYVFVSCHSERSEESSVKEVKVSGGVNYYQEISGFFGLHPQKDSCHFSNLRYLFLQLLNFKEGGKLCCQ